MHKVQTQITAAYNTTSPQQRSTAKNVFKVASSSSNYQTLFKFELFPNLPTELRFDIWKLALPAEFCILSITVFEQEREPDDIYGDLEARFLKQTESAIAHACKESQKVFLEVYPDVVNSEELGFLGPLQNVNMNASHEVAYVRLASKFNYSPRSELNNSLAELKNRLADFENSPLSEKRMRVRLRNSFTRLGHLTLNIHDLLWCTLLIHTNFFQVETLSIVIALQKLEFQNHKDWKVFGTTNLTMSDILKKLKVVYGNPSTANNRVITQLDAVALRLYWNDLRLNYPKLTVRLVIPSDLKEIRECIGP